MIAIRRSDKRGLVDHDWLKARHTFSFGGYRDPQYMGFRCLRVINQDQIAPSRGFGTHPHEDMEIITYIIEGRIEHKDSMGNKRTIERGEVQVMSAGTGVSHSEFNPDPDVHLELLQIWIEPNEKGVSPRYGQMPVFPESRKNQLKTIVSPDGADASLVIHQDAKIFALLLDAGEHLDHHLDPERHYWIQVISGQCHIQNEILEAGDGVAFSKEDRLTIEATELSEMLIFDLP